MVKIAAECGCLVEAWGGERDLMEYAQGIGMGRVKARDSPGLLPPDPLRMVVIIRGALFSMPKGVPFGCSATLTGLPLSVSIDLSWLSLPWRSGLRRWGIGWMRARGRMPPPLRCRSRKQVVVVLCPDVSCLCRFVLPSVPL